MAMFLKIDPRNPSLGYPNPLKKMGRFNHEAVAFDRFNNAYLTEDRSDGLIYKFIPKKYKRLSEGELFALKSKISRIHVIGISLKLN